MMKKLQLALMFTIGLVSMNTYAQRIAMPAPSPLEVTTQQFGMGEVTIEYSRPSVKGRTIFGDVVPYGKIWRTGANAATKLTFTDDVTLDGNAVKSGTYSLYTIPSKDSWEIMLYSDLELGGNVADYKTENEVVRFKVKATKIPLKLETMMISIGNITPSTADLMLMWENTVISIKMATEVDAKVMANIDESMKSEKPDYFRAASYYFENDKDLKQSLEWINKAMEENPDAYYMMFVKAKIEYKLGDKKAGKASAEKTIQLAEKAKSDDYVALAKKLMADNK